jgi:group I intron endonuclease
MGFIYKISNDVNNKVYIGETIRPDPIVRWNAHKAAIKSGKGCPLLRKAVNKYGVEHFKFEVLIVCFDEDVYKYEKEYIKKYNSVVPHGYNANEGGDPTINRTGILHTDETKEKIRNTMRQKYIDDPSLRENLGIKVSKGLKKIDLSSIIRQRQQFKRDNNIPLFKNRDGNKNDRRWSDEVKVKISKGVTNYFANMDELKKMKWKKTLSDKISDRMTEVSGKPIFQYNLNGDLIREFKSINEAVKLTNVGRCSISNNINGRSKTAGGFIWKLNQSNDMPRLPG